MVFAALAASAGEYAVLSTGFRIHSQRHEIAGSLVRLHTGEGTVEIPAGLVLRFEPEDPIPATAAPPPPEPVRVAAAPKPLPKELVERAAVRHGLPPAIVHSVAAVESAYRPDAVSPKGAIGLMQLMPATAAALDADPRDPAQNADAGARHLRELLLKYKNSPDPVRRALAAYNAGEGAVARYGGVPPYRETQLYVEKVLRTYWKQMGQFAGK